MEPDPGWEIKYYTHTGGSESQTSYSVNFPVDTECDILIVGGGGAGGNSMGGGGDAGGVVYTVNQILSGSYVIKVGKGGAGQALTSTGQGNISNDGVESAILNTSGSYISVNIGGTSRKLRGLGGGGGGIYFDPNSINGRNGGNGGGCSETNANGCAVVVYWHLNMETPPETTPGRSGVCGVL